MYSLPSSYGLILFSHASGWLPQETLKNPKSILIDNKREMDITDFADAIPENYFDFIIFEACFMAGIEVAYELKDKADYILVSSAEIVSPGFTEIYKQSAISYLYESPVNLKGFAQSAFNYFNSQSGFLNSATLSIIKTSELDALGNIIKKNYNRDNTVDINTIQHFDRYTYHLFFDFEDYFSSYLQTDMQRQELSEAINSCIIYKAATFLFMDGYNGFEIKKHSGLTTYIQQEQFPYLNTEYQKLKWYKKISEN
ncbi:MAG: clostripain-related cysteine peptidase [Dysgonomonas sp.]|uniref:clostripain-related cysteine peptidase n=1 Tax=Dysgonomonas sp. TaxID=1891233 RepID=UPI003A8A74D2